MITFDMFDSKLSLLRILEPLLSCLIVISAMIAVVY